MARKPAETVQLKLRFPEKLRSRIEAAALKNNQSMNSEIVARLEQSFEKDDRRALVTEVANAASTATLDLVMPLFDPDKGLFGIGRQAIEEREQKPKPTKKDEK